VPPGVLDLVMCEPDLSTAYLVSCEMVTRVLSAGAKRLEHEAACV
jgi:hypothetical protein